jgi:integrase
MRKTLTDKGVAALKPRPQRYAYPDPECRGHYVRVQPSGVKTYVTVARNPYGKQVWHTIGSADVMGIEDARTQARTAIGRTRKGLPASEAPPVQPDAFKVVAETWLRRHVAKEKLRTRPEIERCLAKYVFPHWAGRIFTSIRRSDITALLDHVEDSHGSRQADIVLGIVRSIANWYATRHDDYLSPFTRGMRRVGSKTRKRARVLDDAELRSVWKQAEANGSFGALIRMLLLTGQRRGAVLRMRWGDISTGGVWEIPTEEREKGNAGSLQLPRQALAIIVTQPRISNNPYVFAAARGDGPLNGFSKAKLAFDKHCGVAGWTLHDLRRCARSLLSRAGVRPDIAERVLGHAIPGVEGVYDRHRYDAEKADALAKLAELIENIVKRRPQ